mgnify:FL=1
MGAVRVGDIVRVPLNSRSVAGWVLEILEDGESDHGDKVLDVSKWSSRGPNEEILELARWAAHRYVGRLRTVLTPASPERNVASLPAAQRSIHVDEKMRVDDGASRAVSRTGVTLLVRGPLVDLTTVVKIGSAHV